MVAVHQLQDKYGLAIVDISSGRFSLLEVEGEEPLLSEIERLRPSELLYSEDGSLGLLLSDKRGLRPQAPWHFEEETALRLLCKQFNVQDLGGFGCDHLEIAICAAGCLLQYAKETQRTELPHIRRIQVETRSDSVVLDAATRKNLELDINLGGGKDNTLASVLDRCKTPMGSRLLRRWLNRPLRNRSVLLARQDVIRWQREQYRFETLQGLLRHIGDLERILARIALRSARPRDLERLKNSLAILPELQMALSNTDSVRSQELAALISEFPQLAELLQRAVIENPPVVVRDGGVIAEGYDEGVGRIAWLVGKRRQLPDGPGNPRT